jgi:hypothetical protein
MRSEDIGFIDIVVIATRRSDVLERTLSSFARNLFNRVRIEQLYLNIDPLWADEREDAKVEQLCRSIVPRVVIRRPERPSFGAAVKWGWSQPQSEWFLHLEDDWELTRPIDLTRVAREMRYKRVAQVCFGRTGKEWRRGIFRYHRFVLCPSFFKSSFARMASALMIPELDPEKQFYNGMNPALAAAVKPFRICSHGGRFGSHCLVDIGREWRRQRGITKIIENGVSQWIEPSDQR